MILNVVPLLFVLLGAQAQYWQEENFDGQQELTLASQCLLPGKQDGDQDLSCRGRIPSWSYNFQTGVCEFFIYGGCGGNSNRFSTPQSCLRTCQASSFEPHRPTYRGDPQQRKADYKPKKCNLPSKADGDGLTSCRAYIPSWSYNRKTGICEYFIFGGCGGNENRFIDPEKCVSTCSAKSYESPNKRKSPKAIEALTIPAGTKGGYRPSVKSPALYKPMLFSRKSPAFSRTKSGYSHCA